MTIPYSLARALKEKGFPQENSHFYWVQLVKEELTQRSVRVIPTDIHKILCEKGLAHNIAAPTLEELIDACGVKFVALYAPQGAEGWTNPGDREVWVAESIFGHEEGGATPLEAVANLYLALQT